jgi:hypothetical protein
MSRKVNINAICPVPFPSRDTTVKKRGLCFTLLVLVLGWAATGPLAGAQTQTATLMGTVTPGNDEDYCILLFEANGFLTATYLPVEQEYGESSFSVPVTVPSSGAFTSVATVLGIYGGNGGVNDTPVSVVMNTADASIATALSMANQQAATNLAEDEMVGPETFASTFSGANQVTIFNDMESGAPANLMDLENFVTANASEMVTLGSGETGGAVVPFSQVDPGVATFELVVPEPGPSRLLLAAAGGLVAFAALRRYHRRGQDWS